MQCQAQSDVFIAVDSKASLLQALAYGRQQNLKISILGGGSNVICSPRIPGLVIQLKNLGRTVLSSKVSSRGPANSEKYHTNSAKALACPENDRVRVAAQAGENWHSFVNWTLEQGLRGLENLSLIPGSVGAAPIQNIGAYGVEVDSCLESVTAIHKTSMEERVFQHRECQFAYRDSIFKRDARDWIIWEVNFCFSKSAPLNTQYAELRKAWLLAGCPDDALQVSKLVCLIRQQKLPDPAIIPNAGSFFKNPVISRQQWQLLDKKFPAMISYPQIDGSYKLAAGWLIQHAGRKGFTDNGVGVCDTQALVIVNPGHRSGLEILRLAERIQDSVRAQFGVHLEIEPVIL